MSEEVRIGVFVCHCGVNIASVVNVDEVASYASTLKNVVHAETNLYTCSDAGLNSIKEGIKKYKLNRVIVAACTPRTHEPLFRRICREAGLNPFLFEFVNIREQCSWVHANEPQEATKKAKDLVRMGVAKTRHLKPREEIEIDVEPRALVVGGGISGMNAALSLAFRGFETHLVEKEKYLGGILKKIYKLYPTNQKAESILNPLIKAVKENDRIKLYTSYDGKNVITQLELEEMFLKDNSRLSNFKSVVMVLCAGSRIPERPYCSKICCMNAIKNAMLLKEINPRVNIYILYRDIMTFGEYEDHYYRKSREMGILYLRYNLQNLPILNKKKILVYDQLLGEKIELSSDVIVLSTPLVSPEGIKELSQLLKVPLDANGFLLEAHVKLRPVDFATDGIYLAGCCHWPVDLKEAIAEGYAAAGRASIPLSTGKVKVEPIVSVVDEDKCIGCGLCESICPYKAIEIKITEKGKKAKTISASCKGCGLCGASCPEEAITMQHFSNEQELAMIHAFGEGE